MFDRFKRRWRERRILRECGCICYCSHCREPLNDQADCRTCANGDYMYHCKCGFVSTWDFDSAPVPLLRKDR